jgi:hypothetical protein
MGDNARVGSRDDWPGDAMDLVLVDKQILGDNVRICIQSLAKTGRGGGAERLHDLGCGCWVERVCPREGLGDRLGHSTLDKAFDSIREVGVDRHDEGTVR